MSGINIIGGFTVNAQVPIDERFVVANHLTIDISVRYVGLISYNTTDNIVYKCDNAVSNIWSPLGSSTPVLPKEIATNITSLTSHNFTTLTGDDTIVCHYKISLNGSTILRAGMLTISTLTGSGQISDESNLEMGNSSFIEFDMDGEELRINNNSTNSIDVIVQVISSI